MRPGLGSKEQKKDRTIKAILNKTEKGINVQVIEDHELVCFHDRIIVPRTLQNRIVAWYHEYLVHPGETHMIDTMSKLYY